MTRLDIDISQQWKAQEHSERLLTTLLINGNVNRQVPDEAVPQHMKNYLQRTGRKRGDLKKLIGALSAQKLPLHAAHSFSLIQEIRKYIYTSS